MASIYEETKKRWAEEVVKGNLYYPHESVVRFIMKDRAKNAAFMDFGCGAGRHAIVAARAGYTVWAADYNEEALELGRKREAEEAAFLGLEERINWVKTPENEEVLGMACFDKILAWGSLFYQTRAQIINQLIKLKGWLKNDGLFYADFRTREDSLYGKGERIPGGGTYVLASNG